MPGRASESEPSYLLNESLKVAVIGAGPAGLTAALELTNHGLEPVVFERSAFLGGLARTEEHEGNHFDIGGHRFYTRIPEIQELWERILTDDFRKVRRLSRIYYRGRFFKYPLEPFNALINLGVLESLHILGSYLAIRLKPLPREDTFEEWVINRFGRRLYQTFFKTYTEKVWGIPCSKIQADWAAQRIRGLSLMAAVREAFFGNKDVKTLINEFHYTVLGPGMMWKRVTGRILEKSGQVRLENAVTRVNRDADRIRSLTVTRGGSEFEVSVEKVISSMPLTSLVFCMNPKAPREILDAARQLKYRAFIIVGLTLNSEQLFPDQWIYIHSPDVRVGRIQNFKNWSPEMVADQKSTTVGMEYFCTEGDDLWAMEDSALIELAGKELGALGLAGSAELRNGVVIRQTKAYPVYDGDYRGSLNRIQEFLGELSNLQTIGRNGMHRYNNQDHSMLTGILAARNFLGEDHDLWEVNTERSYYEQLTTTPK